MPFFAKIGNAIASTPPAKGIIEKSKVTSLPGFRGIPIFDVFKFFFRQVRTIGMTERASSIAFKFVMAIPPALIFLFTLIPYFPISKDFERELYALIRDVVPGEKNNAVLISFLKDFITKPRNGLLSLGFVLSLFFSSNAIMGVMRSFNKDYVGFRKRKLVSRRLAALKITFILFAMVFASILLLVGQGVFLKWMGMRSTQLRHILFNIRWVIIVLLFFGSISYIYRHAPSVQKKWRIINPGSIVATFLMLVLTIVFSWWVAHFGRYNQLYGSIGTVLILMLLIYFNSLILLVGFELNVSISSLKKIADERNSNSTGGKDMNLKNPKFDETKADKP